MRRDRNGAKEAKSPQAKRRSIGMVVLYVLVVLAAIALAALVAFNVYMRMAFSDFYKEAAAEFETPGIAEGFVPQDLDYVESDNSWLFSGYMGNGSASPIYRRSADGTVSRIFVYLPGGTEAYTGHGGGITSAGKWVYLTYESSYLTIPLDDVLTADDGAFVTASTAVDVEFTPAFITVLDGQLYLGNYYHEGKYDSPKKMHIEMPDGTMHCAVMYAFDADAGAPGGFSTKPSAVYSIPDKVQGVALVDEKFIFSTSWGIGASHLPIFDATRLEELGTYPYSLTSIVTDGEESGDDSLLARNDVAPANAADAAEEATGTNIVDVPLFGFDSANLIEDIEAPPMSEGIELCEGRVYIDNESASSKYIFGKLYGGSTIYSIKL